MEPINKWLGAIVLAVMVILSGCAGGQDFDYWPDNEVPKGKGVFSGGDGYFTIYRKPAKSPDQQDGQQDAAKTESAQESEPTPE